MKAYRAMSLVDVVVGVGVMLIIFLAIFGAYRLSIDLVLNTKARIGGMSLASQQLEYVRGLPYDSIGTVGGIPSGAIAQSTTTTLNNIPYTLHTLVKYIDDAADGSDNADSNGITADYKEIKAEAFWTIHGHSYSTFAVTRVAPHGIESLANGGTIRVNVFDANALPIGDAQVRIRNASTTPTIDITVDSDAGGSVAFPGAPAASNYRINVSKNGYSSAQTYDVTGQNPNPNPGHMSVVNKKTTTGSFAIDHVGTLFVTTYSPIATGFFSDTFADHSKLSATTSTTVSGNTLHLATDAGGAYAFSGDATSVPIQPSLLTSWDLLTWSALRPTNTNLTVQLYYLSGGQYVLVPDAAVSGNSAGLTSGSVSLATLATSTYPAMQLKASLTTGDASTTPSLSTWKVDYHAGPSPLANVGFTIHGAKTVGTDAGGAPIYKLSQSVSTGANGGWLISPIEWDAYSLALSGSTYDASEQCPSALSVAPLQDQVVSLMLVSHTTNSLRVSVAGNNLPLPGATVSIAGSTNATTTSSSCGQSFFGGLASGTYTLSVSATGYQTNQQNISVSGGTVVPVILSP